MSNGTDTFTYSLTQIGTGNTLAPDEVVTVALPAGPFTQELLALSVGAVPTTNTPGTYTDQLIVTFTF